MPSDPPFWRTKTLAEMTEREWESLCDGCGRCCLVKLEEDCEEPPAAEPAGFLADQAAPPQPATLPDAAAGSPDVYFTDIGCRLLDGQSCRCGDYQNRTRHVPDCLALTPAVVAEIGWLPPSCAYRLVEEGRELYWWHPLVSGDPESVHAAGISVRGRVSASEDQLPVAEFERHIVSWPLRLPKRSRAAPVGGVPPRRRKTP